jgi:hypothetical protein
MKKLPLLIILVVFATIPCFSQEADLFVQRDYSILKVKNNDHFILKMEVCQGCPSYWKLEPFDSTKVRLVGITRKSPYSTPRKGGMVNVFYEFAALETGDTEVKFGFYELRDKEPRSTKTVDVRIE